MREIQGSVSQATHISWKAKIFGGFFPRTGGDVYVAYGQYSEYPGKLTQELAVKMFTEKVTAAGDGHPVELPSRSEAPLR